MPPIFEWDENKARLNLRKHRVTFIEAISVFEDPLARQRSFDSRQTSLGMFHRAVEDEIRIISARRVTKREKNDYEEYIANQT
jgi:uncharacterized DUF497 family protein